MRRRVRSGEIREVARMRKIPVAEVYGFVRRESHMVQTCDEAYGELRSFGENVTTNRYGYPESYQASSKDNAIEQGGFLGVDVNFR